jgi:hypothetical protein
MKSGQNEWFLHGAIFRYRSSAFRGVFLMVNIKQQPVLQLEKSFSAMLIPIKLFGLCKGYPLHIALFRVLLLRLLRWCPKRSCRVNYAILPREYRQCFFYDAFSGWSNRGNTLLEYFVGFTGTISSKFVFTSLYWTTASSLPMRSDSAT